MRSVEAFGPRRAICQRVLAGRTGIPVRRLQGEVVLERLAAGHSVASTCQEPYGLFIARTAAEAGTRKPPTDETGQLLFVEASRTQPR